MFSSTASIQIFNPYLPSIFCPENVGCLSAVCTSVAYFQVHFWLEFIMETNTMNPDQTAPKRGSLIWVNIACKIGYLRT